MEGMKASVFTLSYSLSHIHTHSHTYSHTHKNTQTHTHTHTHHPGSITHIDTVATVCSSRERGGQGKQPSKYSPYMCPCVVIKRFTPPQTAEVREMIHPTALWLEKRQTGRKKMIIGQFFCGQWWSKMNWLAL